MALVKCKECGNQVSTTAKMCPSCGSPAVKRTRPLYKFIAFVFVAGLVASQFPSHSSSDPSSQNSQPATVDKTTQETPSPTSSAHVDLNYDEAIYTTKAAIVCPLGILFDKQEVHSFESIKDMYLSVFNRSEKVKKVGCEEWKSGVRVYARRSENGGPIIEITEDKDALATLFTLESELTNSADGSYRN